MTIWLIGMSASGKTTIGEKLFSKLKSSDEKWVFIDGDTFRNVLGEDLGHSVEDRRKNAYRISRFCQYLSSQGINVLACVLSIFHDNQKYNKKSIKDYKEVFIDVTFENLIKRDNKNLYKKALNGEIKDVVGVDIEFKPPYAPDLVIDNNSNNPDYTVILDSMLKKLNIKIHNEYIYTQNNLLDIPHKYQYSEFEGKIFFDKLKKDRKNSIIFFQGRLKRLNIDPMIFKKNDSYYKDDNLILKSFLINIYLCEKDDVSIYTNILKTIIKRFEVGKKLYTTYSKDDIQKSSKEYKELINYSLFSLVLQKYYNLTNSEERLIYLNALLKVNDIISSAKYEFILSKEVYYAKKAFDGELRIIEELI